MKKIPPVVIFLSVVLAASCFAINFGPGPGGGGDDLTEQPRLMIDGEEELLSEEGEDSGTPKNPR